MAVTYWEAMNIARNPGFQDRVKYGLIQASLGVVVEVNTTPNHAARVTYAQKVLAGTEDMFEACICVMNNATVFAEAVFTNQGAESGYTIPDADIQTAVNGSFNALAGVAT